MFRQDEQNVQILLMSWNILIINGTNLGIRGCVAFDQEWHLVGHYRVCEF